MRQQPLILPLAVIVRKKMKMKKHILLLLTFFLMIKLGYSQRSWQCLLNFETSLHCWGDTLWVDTVNNHNNVWQIGQPNKTIFNSSHSAPNAIVTKLDTFYPTNDTSSFIISHIADMALNAYGIMWINADFKINSDTLSDYGIIEFSPDNGHTWINLMTDTLYLHQNLYSWSTPKPVFSGNFTGWQSFSIAITDHNHYFNISYGDTVLWRFTFISDSVQTFKDGWMLDNIDINDWYENVSENISRDSYAKVYPNPFSSQTIIQTNNILKNATLTVYNSFGQQVMQLNKISGQTIIFHRDNLPSGLYFLRLTQDNKIFSLDKLIIENN